MKIHEITFCNLQRFSLSSLAGFWSLSLLCPSRADFSPGNYNTPSPLVPAAKSPGLRSFIDGARNERQVSIKRGRGGSSFPPDPEAGTLGGGNYAGRLPLPNEKFARDAVRIFKKLASFLQVFKLSPCGSSAHGHRGARQIFSAFWSCRYS
mgnify:CR=1 FL=1